MAAASNFSGEDDRASNGDPVPVSDRLFGAGGALRLLLVTTIVVPLFLGIVTGYLSYQHSYEQAVSSASKAVAFAAENTTKLLDMQRLVAVRVNDLLGSMTDDQVRSLEKSLHEQIAQQIADMPQVVAAWVIGANGRGLVSGRVYPVDRDLDQSARDDFRTFKNSDTRTFFRMLRARSLDGQEHGAYFTVSLRRTG